MRLGPLEIVFIIVIIIAAAVITRIIRTGRGAARQNEESSVKPLERKTKRPRNFFRRTGIAFVLTGIVVFLAGISMFRWALQSYMWSFIIIAIGFVILFLSRKRG